jgi:tetratricopeptide (TPR) repeat protein
VGSTFHQKKHFQAALDSFYLYQQKGGAESGKLFNYLGMCHSQLGDVNQALQYFNQAISLDSSLIESTINCAQMLKESGRGVDADNAFENVIRWFNSNRQVDAGGAHGEGKVDMSRQVFQYRAALQYSLGNYMEALGYLRRYLGDEYDTHDDPLKQVDRVNALVQSALCLQNLGQFREALIFFDDALQLLPDSTCRVQKQLLLYYLMQMNYSWDEFCVDIDFNAQWKESFCKYNNAVTQDQAPFVIRTYDVEDADDILDELDPSYEVEPQLKTILEISRGLSHWIQLDTPGFLSNSRQHKSFGLATLHMAKKLSQHCDMMIAQCDAQLSPLSRGGCWGCK